MSFDLSAPIDAVALAAGKRFLGTLPQIPASNRVATYFDHIYLHWSVERWGCLDGQYNAEVDLEDGQWIIKITHPPLDNAVSVLGSYAAHTYHRNSHAFGIAITGMIDATPSDFGPEAVQVHELEHLCAAAAAVAQRYGIDPCGHARGGMYPNSYAVMTHAEAAIADGYFPGDGDPDSRWDLARFAASDQPLTKAEALVTAALLRRRIAQYRATGFK